MVRPLVKSREEYNAYMRAWGKKNRSKQMGYHLKQKFGISLEDYDGMRILQNNLCAICKSEFSSQTPHIDHDHKTGIIRGILCSQCNVGLGMFQDNVTNLKNAIAYLEDHGTALKYSDSAQRRGETMEKEESRACPAVSTEELPKK